MLNGRFSNYLYSILLLLGLRYDKIFSFICYLLIGFRGTGKEMEGIVIVWVMDGSWYAIDVIGVCNDVDRY